MKVGGGQTWAPRGCRGTQCECVSQAACGATGGQEVFVSGPQGRGEGSVGSACGWAPPHFGESGREALPPHPQETHPSGCWCLRERPGMQPGDGVSRPSRCPVATRQREKPTSWSSRSRRIPELGPPNTRVTSCSEAQRSQTGQIETANSDVTWDGHWIRVCLALSPCSFTPCPS